MEKKLNSDLYMHKYFLRDDSNIEFDNVSYMHLFFVSYGLGEFVGDLRW